MPCKHCPFAFTDESEMIQNYGCLPTPQDIIKLKRESGHNWSCHKDDKTICKGMIEFVQDDTFHFSRDYRDIDMSKGNLIPASILLEKGIEAAIKIANNS